MQIVSKGKNKNVGAGIVDFIINLTNGQLALIQYGIFGVSAIYSVLYMTSDCFDGLSKNLQTVLGICLELAKLNMMVVSITGNIQLVKKSIDLRNFGNSGKAIRVICFLLSVGAFIFSIQASRGYQLVQSENASENKTVNSIQYKEYVKKKESLESDKKNKLEEIKRYEVRLDESSKNDNKMSADNLSKWNDINNQIKSEDRIIQNYKDQIQILAGKSHKTLDGLLAASEKKRAGLITSRDALSNSKDSASSIQAKLDSLNIELNEINTNLNSLSYENVKKKKSSIDLTFGSFKGFAIVFLSILIECLGVMCAVLRSFKNKEMLRIKSADKSIGSEVKQSAPINKSTVSENRMSETTDNIIREEKTHNKPIIDTDFKDDMILKNADKSIGTAKAYLKTAPNKEEKNKYKGIKNDDIKAYIGITLNVTNNNGEQSPGYTAVKDIMKEPTYKNIRSLLLLEGILESAQVGNIKKTLLKDRNRLKQIYNEL